MDQLLAIQKTMPSHILGLNSREGESISIGRAVEVHIGWTGDPDDYVILLRKRGQTPVEVAVAIDRLIYELEGLRNTIMKDKNHT